MQTAILFRGLCIVAMLISMTLVDGNANYLIMVLFFAICGLFFNAAIDMHKRDIELENDLYERMY